jgi:hypothetical protein
VADLASPSWTMNEPEDDVDEDHFPAAAILLVDDHRPNLLTLRAMLEGTLLGGVISTAAAVHVVRATKFALAESGAAIER